MTNDNRDPDDALAEARETMPHPCPVCGEDWPAEDEECPDCGAFWTDRCSLCERKIPRTIGSDLCDYCTGVAKAHARLLQDERDYPDPEPRRQW